MTINNNSGSKDGKNGNFGTVQNSQKGKKARKNFTEPHSPLDSSTL